MTRLVLVGLLDSGLPEHPMGVVAAEAGFAGTPLAPDRLDHGSQLARIIWQHAPMAALLSAQVFGSTWRTAPDLVAAGLAWLHKEGAVVINLSLGLAQDRPVLAGAVAEAVAAGPLLLAAAPARGPLPYPAAYPGVVTVTGDARCGLGELADLGGQPADLGAAALDAAGAARGASFAVAQVTGMVAAEMAQHGCGAAAALARLRTGARWRGPERRRS